MYVKCSSLKKVSRDLWRLLVYMEESETVHQQQQKSHSEAETLEKGEWLGNKEKS